MNYIDGINITNFKALNNIILSPKPINIIVGSNNSGKTSLLEAIALNLSLLNNDKDFVGNNIWSYLYIIKQYNKKFLIRDKEETSEIISEINGKKIKLVIQNVKTGFPEEVIILVDKYFNDKFNEYIDDLDLKYRYIKNFQSDAIRGGKIVRNSQLFAFIESEDNKLSKDVRMPRSRKTSKPKDDDIMKEVDKEISRQIEYYVARKIADLKDRLYYPLFNCEKILLKVYVDNLLVCFYFSTNIDLYPSNRRNDEGDLYDFYYSYLDAINDFAKIPVNMLNVKGIPFITYFNGLPKEKTELYHDIVVKNNKINYALELIKKRVSYIDDVRKTEDGLQVFIKDIKHPLPLTSMGDGLKSLISLTFINSLIENGIIIIEEPEASLHPGFIKIFTDGILQSSNDLQFFVTSHSLDFINDVLNSADKHGKINDVQILRMHKMEYSTKIFLEVIAGKDAKDEIDAINTDLRGA